MKDSTTHHILWAKTSSDGRYHPLFCHCLDVGVVAEALLDAPAMRHVVLALARVLGTDEASVRRLVPYLIALHDVCKASPSFQRKAPDHWQRVVAGGFPGDLAVVPHFDHAHEAYLALVDLIDRAEVVETKQPRLRVLRAFAQGVAAHHGRFFTSGGHPEIPHDESPDPSLVPWREVRRALATDLRAILLGDGPPVVCAPRNLSALSMLLSGLTVLCDWIGSDQAIFEPYAGDRAAYPDLARKRARQALGAHRLLLGYLPRPSVPPTFRESFGQDPRPVQAAVEADALPLPGQSLVVIEAPTGEGKTEAALLLARRLAFDGLAGGLYFALPTMATSNQMFERVEHYLSEQLGAGKRATLHLIHGLAELSPALAELLERAGDEGLEPTERVVADSWLLPRKRSLLAPYGVGTVDQALLAALNVRFGSLRMFGLAGKVVVIDEVHAYDLYMSTILDQLLRWLGALGASVVLLSATLPRSRREGLIAAFRGEDAPTLAADEPLDPYPLLTVAAGPKSQTAPRHVVVPAARPRPIAIERRLDGADRRIDNARFLLDEVAAGGCAAWLCNTVAEAQTCYLALKGLVADLPPGARPELILFHARFPYWRRREIERRVLARFGKGGDRPHRAILVATQVVEQSLDVDFDVMLTQLAPIDLLVQRAGRVCRHERQGRPDRPRLVLLMPSMRDGVPDFGPSGFVYEPYVLLRTIAALEGVDAIAVPDDLRCLIERVYGTEPLDLAAAGLSAKAVADALNRLKQNEATMQSEAQLRLLQNPLPDGSFAANPRLPFQDDEAEANAWVAAQTRLAEPSVRAILLERTHPLVRRLTSSARVRLRRDELAAVLDHAVTLTNGAFVGHAMQRPAPPGIHSMDNMRGLTGRYLIELTGGVHRWETSGANYRLELTDELGVVIEKEP